MMFCSASTNVRWGQRFALIAAFNFERDGIELVADFAAAKSERRRHMPRGLVTL